MKLDVHSVSWTLIIHILRASIWMDVLPQDLVKYRGRPQDSGLDLSNRSEIWQATQQQHSRKARKISQQCNHYNIQYRNFKTFIRFGGKKSARLVNRGPGYEQYDVRYGVLLRCGKMPNVMW